MAKMKSWEKFLTLFSFLTIVVSVIIRCLCGVHDMDNLVILAFMGILMFVIFLISSFFPADWRMTEKQKARIGDMDVYQEKYRKIFICITFAISFAFAVMIFLLS